MTGGGEEGSGQKARCLARGVSTSEGRVLGSVWGKGDRISVVWRKQEMLGVGGSWRTLRAV